MGDPCDSSRMPVDGILNSNSANQAAHSAVYEAFCGCKTAAKAVGVRLPPGPPRAHLNSKWPVPRIVGSNSRAISEYD
jgi:hypothetical protein